MSLVNDMLRDLDARKSTDDRDLDIAQAAPSSASQGRGRGILAGATVALLLAGFVGGYWLFQQPTVEVPVALQAPQNAAAPVQAASPPEVTTQPVQSQGPVSVLPIAAVSASETSEPAHANAVEQLLAAAEQALAQDRLTQPPVNNAYALYSHALLLAPDNENARAGVERVRSRYEQLVREAVRVQDWDLADQYVERAARVGLPGERLAALRTLAQGRDREQPENEQQVARVVNPPAQAATAPTPGAPVEAQEVNIEKSWSSREADAVLAASRLLQQGREGEAAASLQQMVASYPKAEAAALLLFDIYMRSGDSAQAHALQDKVQNPLLKRFFEAKLLAEVGQRSEALAMLEQQNPTGVVAEPWLALQAALYQQNGGPQQAQALYQRLVQMDNRQVNYWLGLGVAAEAAGQPQQALRAFIAANQLQPSNAAVSSYISQRIEALSR